ncbi:MAG: glycosyltransferase [Winogradskyella sp.]|uniref:glycosyltransferase n=1 Tax=Winogradskyella sp. TaxID=1883156 RepID=UPI0018510559|nr:glycosyltransferase [Winogradskyella sp.]
MKLSIIVPVYNSEKFLSKSIENLISQGLADGDFEIIIVDDGSTDGSAAIAMRYQIKHSCIRIINKINGGVGSARNAGLDIAKGKYIYFIDPDDFMVDKVLSSLLTLIEANKLDILTFNSEIISELSMNKGSNKTINHQIALSPITNGRDYLATQEYQNECWWYIVDASFLRKSNVRFINGRWMEDAIFTAQLFLRANKMAHSSIVAHKHLIVDGSAMTSKEKTHYVQVIKDNYNAAIVFDEIIDSLEINSVNRDCIDRLKTRQQSFVFFMMVRILKSSISLKEIRSMLTGLEQIGAYPLNAFISRDYNKLSYRLLVKVFNQKWLYLLIFKFCNPVLRRVYS